MVELDDHYCGPSRNKPMVDVKKDDFFLICLVETIYLIWLSIVESHVEMDIKSENHKKVLLQYWAPICKRGNAQVYTDCWNKYGIGNKKDPVHWESMESHTHTHKHKVPQKIKIPPCMFKGHGKFAMTRRMK